MALRHAGPRPIREKASPHDRLSVPVGPLVGPVQPERAEGRLPNYRAEYLLQPHRQVEPTGGYAADPHPDHAI